MAWAKPHIYSANQVRKAGASLVQGSDDLEALGIVNHWRLCHALPMGVIGAVLRREATRIDNDCSVAQRLKRLHSIKVKLSRQPKMKLSTMQDLAGCRVVFSDLHRSYRLQNFFEQQRAGDRWIVHGEARDYNKSPKADGYRGIHVILAYRGRNRQDHDGLKVEIQIRSRLQHAWATAVETFGYFTGQDLKGGRGSPGWIEFFALMGSEIAHLEKSILVPGTSDVQSERRERLKELTTNLDIERIGSIQKFAMEVREDLFRAKYSEAHYFLLALQKDRNLGGYIKLYTRERLKEAHAESVECEQRGDNAVLVETDNIDELKRMYPNYFSDINEFMRLLRVAIGKTF